jgi:hypothetical protein
VELAARIRDYHALKRAIGLNTRLGASTRIFFLFLPALVEPQERNMNWNLKEKLRLIVSSYGRCLIHLEWVGLEPLRVDRSQ